MSNLVRFRFFGEGHNAPHTGHLLIMRDPQGWHLTNWSKTKKQGDQIHGTDPLKGGEQFVAEVNNFVSAWGKAQQEAIEQHRTWSSNKRWDQMLVRPGFRAIQAKKQWDNYIGGVQREYSSIEADVLAALHELHIEGWTPAVQHVDFPIFVYGAPSWRK